ncbi:MAG: 4Fe-4S dicluster domain-containing protein [Chloroflexota bacterium]
MTRYGMVIDLQRCTGCGACIVACKNENNLPEGISWSDKIAETEGTFPNVRYTYIPTLCNHCDNAPCVSGCPTEAMHYGENGIVVHNPQKCIGCRYCMARCPYGAIQFNWEDPHEAWKQETALIAEGTASPVEVTEKVGGNVIPYYNPAPEATYTGLRRRGVVEKCNFCAHRLAEGELPYCVEACPADARIFGDLDDPDSEISQILAKFKATRLREEEGTEPKVFYVREFNRSRYEKTKGGL